MRRLFINPKLMIHMLIHGYAGAVLIVVPLRDLPVA